MTNEEFGSIYESLYKDMVKAASKALNVYEDAEDVVNEVFCDILASKRVRKLKTARNVRAFLFCRLIWEIGKVLDYNTRIPLEPLQTEEEVEDEYNLSEDPLAVLLDEDKRVDVDMALQQLSPDQRIVVESVIITGRDFIKTGKALWPGLEPYARRRKVSDLYRIGITALRRLLQEYHTHN